MGKGDTIRASGRDNTVIVNVVESHTHDADGAVILDQTKVDEIMAEQDVDARGEVEQVAVGAGASGASAERASSGTETGQVGTSATEVSHKGQADVAVEEVVSSVNAHVLANLAALQFGINQTALQTLNSAQAVANAQNGNLADNSNLQNKIALVQWADMDNIVEAKVAEALNRRGVSS
jgi:hypothetical protein